MNDKKLVNLVKKYKNLYVRRSKDYNNKLKRIEAWKEISSSMKCDEISCQTRWKNIRDRYVRISQRNQGSGSEDCGNDKSWHLLEHLQFLTLHIKPRRVSIRQRLTPIKEETPTKNALNPLADASKGLGVRTTSRKPKRGDKETNVNKEPDEINKPLRGRKSNEVQKSSPSKQTHEEIEEYYEELDDEKLISEVKKYKNLYERGHKDYRNKSKTSKAWREISLDMKFDEATCRSRWKNIRDHYVKMSQRYEASGGKYALNPNNSQLFEHLKFINDYIKPRKYVKPASTSTNDESLFEEILYSASTEDVGVPPGRRKRKSDSEDSVNTNHLDEMHGYTKHIENNRITELLPSKHLHFLKLIEQKLEELPEDQHDDIKLTIITYVFNCVKESKNNENMSG